MKVNKEQLRQSIETILINSVWTSEDTSHQIMEAVEPLIIALEVLQERLKTISDND